MAAGLGFKDFTTGEVLTAADVDGYLMQGVWVFASAAARDAAVTSPQEGNFAYLKDTNVTTYYTGSAWANLDTTGMTNPMTTTGDTIYSSSGSTPARLGIGSTGQVLTVAGGIPSWATPAGGGGYTLIAEQTASSSTGIDFTSIPSTYKTLLLVWSGIQQDGDRDFEIRLNADTASNYAYSASALFGASSVTAEQTSASRTTIGSGNDYYLFGRRATSASLHQTVKGFLRIENANSTTKLKYFVAQGMYYDASAPYTVTGSIQGIYNSTSAISQINIVRISGAGTITNLTNTSIQLWGLS